MKKALTLILAVIILAAIAIPAFAAEAKFNVFSESENEFIYKNEGTWDADDSRVCDETQYIIYAFSIDSGDTYASLELAICNQYKIEAAAANPDDAASYKTVTYNEPSEQEKADAVPYWGTAAIESNTVVDLSEFCSGNSTGKIYVKISDADPSNGWGSKIYKDTPVTFSHGSNKEVAEVQSFAVASSEENAFMYKNQNTWTDQNNRICDNDTFVIYAFDVVNGANFAQLDIYIHNQYKIEVATENPSEAGSFKLVEQLNIPEDANLTDEPWWGANDSYELHSIDLSAFCTTGKIYVKIGDVTPDTGWGGKIEGTVSFTSKYVDKTASEPAAAADSQTQEAEPEIVTPVTVDAVDVSPVPVIAAQTADIFAAIVTIGVAAFSVHKISGKH